MADAVFLQSRLYVKYAGGLLGDFRKTSNYL